MPTSKARFRAQFQNENDLPIFLQPWWMDLTCGENNWDVALIEKANKIQALWLYHTKTKYGFKGIGMQPYTHFSAYWIYYPTDQKPSSRLSLEKKLLTELNNLLPELSYFEQIIAPNFQNCLPLKWQGFQQTTLYTYVLEQLEDLEKLEQNISSNTRASIRKGKLELKVQEDEDATILFDLIRKSYEKYKMKCPYDLDSLQSLVQTCAERNCGKIHLAVDENGKAHSASFIVWDQYSAYSILRGNAVNGNSHAGSFLTWEVIKWCNQNQLQQFDFVGSYIKNIEFFIRNFGAKQVPYFYLTKINSKPYAALRKLYDFKNLFLRKK